MIFRNGILNQTTAKMFEDYLRMETKKDIESEAPSVTQTLSLIYDCPFTICKYIFIPVIFHF